MSLSNHPEHTDRTKSSWKAYEIRSLDTILAAPEKAPKAFVALRFDHTVHSDFMPFEVKAAHSQTSSLDRDVLETAHDKTAFMEQEAYEKGFEQGEKDGYEIGEKKALKIVDRLETLCLSLVNLQDHLIKAHEQEILEVIFSVAEAVLNQQITDNRDVIKATILKALELAAERCEINIHVNPEDYAVVEKLKPEFFLNAKELKSIVVTSDNSVERGGCFLETPKGDIDARVETRLNKIRQCLVNAFHGDSNA